MFIEFCTQIRVFRVETLRNIEGGHRSFEVKLCLNLQDGMCKFKKNLHLQAIKCYQILVESNTIYPAKDHGNIVK
jgi:hypothetical protein